jgi:hypothetical protein
MNQVIDALKAVFGALVFGGVVLFGAWVKKVFDQKKRNEVNEVDLTLKKINLDVHSKPLDNLVDESNKSHGAHGVVNPTGSDDEGGSKGPV